MSESSFQDLLHELHPVDVACLLFIAWQAIAGALRGFAFQAVRLVTWAGGLFVARQYAPRLAERIMALDFGWTIASATIIAWFLLVASTLLAGMVVLRLVRGVIATWKLGGLDRAVGFGFGVAKAGLIILVAMIVAFAVARPIGCDAYLARSKAAAWSGAIVAETAPALPSDLGSQFEQWIAAAKARVGSAEPDSAVAPR